MTALTPMMKQYQAIKKNHQDCILFYRLGDFYEMFFDDAIIASKEMEITLTARDGGNGSKIPMCGVPYHAAEGYLAKLISKGYRVAICEQVEDPRSVKGIVRREVVRIVSPGTVLETNILSEHSSNYLMALFRDDDGVGLAYTDISTGEFYATEITGAEDTKKVMEEISRISPVEILLSFVLFHDEPFKAELRRTTNALVSRLSNERFNLQTAKQKLISHFNLTTIEPIGLNDLPLAACAAGSILEFLGETQKRHLQHINHLRVYTPQSFMLLDPSTRRNLELTQTIRTGQRKGSLLWICDRTVTSLGARLLKQWIEKPLIDPYEINRRLDAVDELSRNVFIREDLRHHLSEVYDLERLTGRVCFGNASARDLIALKKSLQILPELIRLQKNLKSNMFQELVKDTDALDDITALIESSINENAPLSVKDGGIIKEGYHRDIDELRLVALKGKKWIAELEAQEKQSTGIKSLKVGFNKVFGYYIEITNTNLSQVPPTYIRRQTLANAERFVTEELKEWESKVLGAGERLAALEYQLFSEIRETIAKSSARIQKVAKVIASLDVLVSLAVVALENRYVRPELTDDGVINIIDGRHPVVERILHSENYVPNDTYLDNAQNQLCLITGPNMAGKSTYMRQVALIVLLAQIGSFVPAKKAQISVVDRIFTRVGAADDLAGGQSTFMVEMSETSNILRNATRSSLVILDEIGRGTSTYDGISIAWAVAEYLLKPGVGAKTLFATHYHELTQLTQTFTGVKNYTVAIKEQAGDIVFLRKIMPGSTDKSYGIQVAKLAGLPLELLHRAREILVGLEQNNNFQVAVSSEQVDKPVQIRLFADEPAKHPFIIELETKNLAQMTPLDALILLNDWQKKLRENG